MGRDQGHSAADLPVALLERVLARAAAALPDVTGLPAELRRVAAFTPTKRARLGRTALLAALADDDVRERVGHQVGSAAHDVTAGSMDEVAVAWLTRADGWRELVDAAVAAERVRDHEAEAAQAARDEERVSALEAELRAEREKHRAEVESLRAELHEMRQKVGRARSEGREELRSLREQVDAAERGRRLAEEDAAAARREEARLTTALDRAEKAREEGRRTERGERDRATLRARVLLDTVLEATAGLRRELALPPAEGSLEDEVHERWAVTPGSGAHATEMTPQMLEQHLTMPRARLIVDGYNVTKSIWPESSLEAQRTRLLKALAPLVARTGAETTVVFDAADADTRAPVSVPRGVRVLFSPVGVIADDVIVDLVEAEPDGRGIVVVTDDQELRRRARGCRSVSPRRLFDAIA